MSGKSPIHPPDDFGFPHPDRKRIPAEAIQGARMTTSPKHDPKVSRFTLSDLGMNFLAAVLRAKCPRLVPLGRATKTGF
jgi:hypothetical protein